MATQRQYCLLASDYNNREELAILVSSLVYFQRVYKYSVHCSLAKSAVEVALSANRLEAIHCTLDNQCDPRMDQDSIYENSIISVEEVQMVAQEAHFQVGEGLEVDYPIDETEESFKDRLHRLLFRGIAESAIILTPRKCVKVCLETLEQNFADTPVISLWNLSTELPAVTCEWYQQTKDHLKETLLQVNCFFEQPPEPSIPTRKSQKADKGLPAAHLPLDDETSRIFTQLAAELAATQSDILPESDNPTHQLLLATAYALKAHNDEINRLKDGVAGIQRTELQTTETVAALRGKVEELQEVAPIVHVVMRKRDAGVQEEEKLLEQEAPVEPKGGDQQNPDIPARELGCSKCENPATKFCLCVPDKVFFCEQCIQDHMKNDGAHLTAHIKASPFVNQLSDLKVYNQRLETTRKTKEAMEAILQALMEGENSLAENLAREKQKVFDDVNQAFEALQPKLTAQYQAVRANIEQVKDQLDRYEKNLVGLDKKAMYKLTSLCNHFLEVKPLLLEASDFCRESFTVRIEEREKEVHHPIRTALETWETAKCVCGSCENTRYILLKTSIDPNQGFEGEYNNCFFHKNISGIAEIEMLVVKKQGEDGLKTFKKLAVDWRNSSSDHPVLFMNALISTDLRNEKAARASLESKGFQFT